MKTSIPLATTVGSLVLAGLGAFTAELPAPARLPGPAGPLSRAGAGPSHAPVVSADGRYVVLVSAAPNLVPGDANGRLDVFRRDRLAGRTELVSVNAAGTGPGNGPSAGAVMSADGRWIAIESRAGDLVPNDTNGLSDVFLRDMEQGHTVLVSRAVAAAGGGNGPSTVLQITPDGRFVLFESRADNLVAWDTNAWTDLFLFDRAAGTVERVSEPPAPEVQSFTYSGSPALSADGQWIAFIGAAVAPGGAISGTDVYLRDRAAGRTWRVSTPTAGNWFSQASQCSLSADGAVVAFIGPSRFVAAENPLEQIAFYRWSRTEQRTYAVPALPTLPNAVEVPMQGPVLNADGTRAVFAVQGHVFVWEAGGLEPRLVTTAAGGLEPAAGVSAAPRISPDGRQVWFLSQATNLTATPPPAGWQLYRHDLPGGPTTLSSAVGGGGSGQVLAWDATPDGATAVFESDAPWPEGGDLNADADVFAWQAGARSPELISLAHAPQPPRARYQLLPRRPMLGSSRGEPLPNAVSADGRRLACLEAAPGASDGAAGWAIAVVDLESGTNVARLDFPPTSPDGMPVQVLAPQLSEDGRVLVFGCSADGLVPDDTNGLPDVFRYEIETGTLSRVSTFEPGQPMAKARLGEVALDPGGRFVAFVRVRSGETTGSDLWWRDLNEPYARPLATNGQFSTMSFTGEGCRFLLDSTVKLTSDPATFSGTIPYGCYAWDCRTGEFELMSRTTDPFQSRLVSTSGMRVVAAADGRTLAYIGLEPGASLSSPWRVFVLTPDSPAAWVVSLSPGGAPNSHSADSPGISRDGRRIVFTSMATNLVEPGWTSLVAQVFVRHVPEQFTTLVSRSHGGPGPADAPCMAARIAPSGRFVLFRSAASNLLPGDTNGVADWFLRDLDAGVTWRLGRVPEATEAAPVGDAIWSADSRVVIMEGTTGRQAAGSLASARELWVLHLAGPDTDGDGLDDDWEMAHFSTLEHDGTGDHDQDGASDLAEFRAGTRPTNDGSVLRVLTLQPLGADMLTVLWKSEPGRRYVVQTRSMVTVGTWLTLPGTVMASGATASLTVATGVGVQQFYRVLAVPYSDSRN